MSDSVQICRGFTVAGWRALRPGLDGQDRSAWDRAVDVFERRIRERFISCIEVLHESDSEKDVDAVAGDPPCAQLPDDVGTRVIVPGFAIVGLCAALMEALHGFREGDAGTNESIRSFLKLPAFNGQFDEDAASAFANGLRNGILHEAETRGWVIWRSEPVGRIIERCGRGYAVNRTELFVAVKRAFNDYLEDLRSGAHAERRRRFLKKMDDLVSEC